MTGSGQNSNSAYLEEISCSGEGEQLSDERDIVYIASHLSCLEWRKDCGDFGSNDGLISSNSNERLHLERKIRPPGNCLVAVTEENVRITTGDSPSLREALKSTSEARPLWLGAIKEEFDYLEEKGTLEIDDHSNSKLLPTYVICTIKRNYSVNVEHFRERIVSGGNLQVLCENIRKRMLL